MKDNKIVEVTKIMNIKVGERLWRLVKSKAALEGKTITDWITELLEKSVNNN